MIQKTGPDGNPFLPNLTTQALSDTIENSMKKYLLAPSQKWFRANLHCHTNISDGKLTPQEVKDLYKSRGYSVIAYSDHDQFVPHNDLTDDAFVAINSAEYAIGFGDFARLPVPAGCEVSWLHEPCFHFNIFATDQGISETPGRDTIWGAQRNRFDGTDAEKAEMAAFSYSKCNDLIAKCNDAGFLVQLNHPYWSLNTREDCLALEGLWALEILNYATQRETGAEYCPMLFDDMLRHRGPGLFCTMDDDNHNPPSMPPEEHSFGGSTFFAADELSYAAIADSMKKGRFFCASGLNPPRFEAVWIEDGRIHAEFSPVDLAILTGYGRFFRQARGAGITSAEFDIPANEPYFRLTLIDRQGNFANTNAFAVESLKG